MRLIEYLGKDRLLTADNPQRDNWGYWRLELFVLRLGDNHRSVFVFT
jgi:hypothetical protein